MARNRRHALVGDGRPTLRTSLFVEASHLPTVRRLVRYRLDVPVEPNLELIGLTAIGGGEADQNKSINLCELLEESIRSCNKAGVLPIPVLNCQNENIQVTVDRDRMSANIAHILQNAQDATDDTGSITVRLRRQGPSAVIEVEDTGEGMDEAFIHDRLFQPFESTKGTMGIGVFQVREYVNKLGGKLEVESKPGLGSLFRLFIPLSEGNNKINDPQVVRLENHEKRN